MVTLDPVMLIARRKEIAEEIARLQKEDGELEIVLRVLPRFEKANGKSKDEAGAEDDSDEEGAPRPEGTPTNFDMVEAVLAAAEKEGKDGLTASEIVAEIEKRFWPGLLGKQILPALYGFGKKGRLKKTPSGKFKRIKKSEAPNAEASEP